MAHAARPLTMTTEPQRTSDNEDTGRFAIDASERGTMLPPAEDGAKDVLSLEELGGSLIETKPRTAPPPPPARAGGPISGVFPSGGKADPDAAFAERIISLSPIYTPAESAQSERAVLDIEDLSLRPDNPYLASSLVPPSEPAGRRTTLIAVAAAALLAGAGAGWYFARAPHSAPTAPRQPSVQTAAVSKPAAVVASVPAVTTSPVETAVPTEQAAKPAPIAPVAQHPVAPSEHPVIAKPAAVAPVAQAGTAVPAAAVETPAPAQAADTAAHVPAPAAEAPPQAVAAPPSVAAANADGALPQLPSREQVAAGFDAVRVQLEQCAAGQHGVASVAATVTSSGRVSYAQVQGKFSGTPEGSCMALAVRKAQFPAFSQSHLKVVYPFSL